MVGLGRLVCACVCVCAEMPTLEGPNAGGLPSLEGPNAGRKIKMLEVYIACYNFL